MAALPHATLQLRSVLFRLGFRGRILLGERMWWRSSSSHVLACAALAVALLFAGCERRTSRTVPPPDFRDNLVAVEQQQQPLVDENYCFRLTAPSNQWKLLPEREVQQLLPDAVAGMMYAGGVYGAVIVEPMPTADLRSFAELARVNLPPGDSQTSSIDEIVIGDRTAMRFRRTGLVNGLDLTFEHLIQEHQNFAYQLVCWGMTGRVTTDLTQEFFQAFAFTEGQVKARASAVVTSYQGVGCRVVDGEFQSAAYRLAVQPQGDWQLMIGASLAQSAVDAEIGLQNAIKNGYLVVIPEFIGENERQAFADNVAATLVQDLELDAGSREVVQFAVDGHPTEFEIYRGESVPFLYYSGTHFVDDIAYRMLGWHPDHSREMMREEMRTAVSLIHFLDKPAADALATQLLEAGDSQNLVGPGFSLRNGVYRDFVHGVEWTKPRGFWRVQLGDEARERNEACSLIAMEPGLGIQLLVVDEPAGEFTPHTYHQAVLDNMFGVDEPPLPPETIQLGGQVALVSDAMLDAEPMDVAYRVATVVQEGQAHQIVLSGNSPRFGQQREQIERILRGFRFPGQSLVESERPGPGAYRDHRIGFELVLTSGNWITKDDLRPEIKPLGSIVQFARPPQSVIVLGLYTVEPMQEMRWATDTIRQLFSVNFSRLADTKPIDRKSVLGGLPCTIQTWEAETETIHTVLLQQFQTIFCLVVVDTPGGSLLQEAMRGFRLLP